MMAQMYLVDFIRWTNGFLTNTCQLTRGTEESMLKAERQWSESCEKRENLSTHVIGNTKTLGIASAD